MTNLRRHNSKRWSLCSPIRAQNPLQVSGIKIFKLPLLYRCLSQLALPTTPVESSRRLPRLVMGDMHCSDRSDSTSFPFVPLLTRRFLKPPRNRFLTISGGVTPMTNLTQLTVSLLKYQPGRNPPNPSAQKAQWAPQPLNCFSQT